MSNVLKVNVSVITQKGAVVSDNKDEFYLNGKFTSESQVGSLQASLENRGVEYVFAVSDKLTLRTKREGATLSMVKSLRKYHEKVAINSGDMEFRINELKSRVEEVSRLADSMMDMPIVGRQNEDEEKKENDVSTEFTGFSGVILTEGQLAALTVGTSKAFLMREGVFKPLTVDYAKTKRLLELGIITDEEVELYSNKFGSRNENLNDVQVSEVLEIREGDKILLCTDGLTDYVEDERIEDLLSMRSDSAYIANMMLSEAKKSGSQDDVTIMVIRVEQVNANTPVKKSNIVPRNNKMPYREKNKDSEIKIPTYKYSKKDLRQYEGILRIVLVVLTTAILIAMVLWMVNMMYKNGRDDNNKNNSDDNAITSPIPLESAEETTSTDQSVGVTDVDENQSTQSEGSEQTPNDNTSNTDSFNSVKKYVVVAGDNMRQISIKEYGTEVYYKKLAKYNNKTNYNDIKIGEELLIPSKEVIDKVEILDTDFEISTTQASPTPKAQETTATSSGQSAETTGTDTQSSNATEATNTDSVNTSDGSTIETENTDATSNSTEITQ